MKIKFIGVPGEEHSSIRMYDQSFALGRYVEVKDAFAAKKLSNHPHFQVKPGDEPEDTEAAA